MLTRAAITLSAKRGSLWPEVCVRAPGHRVQTVLRDSQRFDLEFDHNVGWIKVEFYNKPQLDLTMAVIIDQVEFFGISDPRFVWAGIYSPQYPEPWFSQQNPAPMAQLPGQNYLGWNGVWRLDFSVPVFTWMHRTMNLGWIYH